MINNIAEHRFCHASSPMIVRRREFGGFGDLAELINEREKETQQIFCMITKRDNNGMRENKCTIASDTLLRQISENRLYPN